MNLNCSTNFQALPLDIPSNLCYNTCISAACTTITALLGSYGSSWCICTSGGTKSDCCLVFPSIWSSFGALLMPLRPLCTACPYAQFTEASQQSHALGSSQCGDPGYPHARAVLLSTAHNAHISHMMHPGQQAHACNWHHALTVSAFWFVPMTTPSVIMCHPPEHHSSRGCPPEVVPADSFVLIMVSNADESSDELHFEQQLFYQPKRCRRLRRASARV